MRFEWDNQKEKANIKKHKMDFTTAAFVFDDDNRLEIFDREHSDDEDRYIAIGLVDKTLVIITVAYTERGQKIRLISARKATAKERRMYYDNLQGY
ncbi:MAG: BrnT family toxin [Prevotella sp.]|nr:BrnT family toxin [Prevotella sp.]